MTENNADRDKQQEVRSVIACLEHQVGSDRSVELAKAKTREITTSSIVNEEHRFAIDKVTDAIFLDGMRYALGLIGSFEVRYEGLVRILTMMPIIRLEHPESSTENVSKAGEINNL